ncbi:hypothetical protein N9917_00225 [Deltaproteobacteria bacterium]|nr:hypothetical protein [Deltaproteobacteria bacterium]
MTSRRKLLFDRADSTARRKRLNFVLHNPEQAESEAELERAVKYTEYMVDRTEDALDIADQLIADLEDPRSELRQTLDPLKKEMGVAMDSLRDSIERAEAALVKVYKGRCASVELVLHNPPWAPTTDWALLFWHVKGVWGLYTIDAYAHVNKLTSAPNKVRMAAMEALDDLWHALQYEDEAA